MCSRPVEHLIRLLFKMDEKGVRSSAHEPPEFGIHVPRTDVVEAASDAVLHLAGEANLLIHASAPGNSVRDAERFVALDGGGGAVRAALPGLASAAEDIAKEEVGALDRRDSCRIYLLTDACRPFLALWPPPAFVNAVRYLLVDFDKRLRCAEGAPASG